MENYSTNMHIVGEDLLRAFYDLFQVISKKTLRIKDFTRNLKAILNENNHNYNSYKFSYKSAFISFLFFRGIKLSGSYWSGNEKYLRFLFIGSCPLLQRYVEFIRLLKGFLTCYFCSYYSSIPSSSN